MRSLIIRVTTVNRPGADLARRRWACGYRRQFGKECVLECRELLTAAHKMINKDKCQFSQLKRGHRWCRIRSQDQEIFTRMTPEEITYNIISHFRRYRCKNIQVNIEGRVRFIGVLCYWYKVRDFASQIFVGMKRILCRGILLWDTIKSCVIAKISEEGD